MTTEHPHPDHSGSDLQHTSPTRNKYNTAAYQPMDQYGTVAQRPKQLGTLRNLTIFSLILYVLSAVPGMIVATDKAVVEQKLRESGTLTEAQIDEMLEITLLTGMITTIIMMLLAIVLYIVVLVGISKAKNWGRILGITLAILGGVETLVGIVRSFGDISAAPTLTIVSLVIGGIWLLVSIWWLVTAFSAPVRNYFTTPPHARS